MSRRNERAHSMFLSVSAGSSHTAKGWVIHATARWVSGVASSGTRAIAPPHGYYENLERDFRRLDIAGIHPTIDVEIGLVQRPEHVIGHVMPQRCPAPVPIHRVKAVQARSICLGSSRGIGGKPCQLYRRTGDGCL